MRGRSGDFVTVLVEGPAGSAFRRELKAFIAATARATAVASLAQTVLQLTLPGIPDLYRGIELADFSLVDPDNRRPVDWKRRVALLRRARSPCPGRGRRGVTKFRATPGALDAQVTRTGAVRRPLRADGGGAGLAGASVAGAPLRNSPSPCR